MDHQLQCTNLAQLRHVCPLLKHMNDLKLCMDRMKLYSLHQQKSFSCKPMHKAHVVIPSSSVKGFSCNPFSESHMLLTTWRWQFSHICPYIAIWLDSTKGFVLVVKKSLEVWRKIWDAKYLRGRIWFEERKMAE